MNDQQLNEVLQHAIAIARQAGTMIREGQINDLGQEEKKSSIDLVTKVDKAVEAFLRTAILDKFPAHKFVGEESYKGEAITDEPTWICVNKIPVVGVVYNPVLDQMYHGARGCGAYLTAPSYGPSPINLPLKKPEALTSLSNAIVAVDWGYARKLPTVKLNSNAFLRLAADPADVEGGKLCHSVRETGSAALNVCMVAAGMCDVFWEIGCWPWDVCAGMAIAQETGVFMAGSQEGSMSGEASYDILVGRKYLMVRPMKGKGDKSGNDLQLGLVREMFETVGDYDP